MTQGGPRRGLKAEVEKIERWKRVSLGLNETGNGTWLGTSKGLKLLICNFY